MKSIPIGNTEELAVEVYTTSEQHEKFVVISVYGGESICVSSQDELYALVSLLQQAVEHFK